MIPDLGDKLTQISTRRDPHVGGDRDDNDVMVVEFTACTTTAQAKPRL